MAVPKLRFKDGNGQDYIVWERKSLEAISELITVGIANSATHAYTENGVVMFRNLNIKPNELDDSDIVHISTEFARKYEKKKLQENDIIVCRTGYPGSACIVPNKYNGAQTFTTLIIRIDKSKANVRYVCQYINSDIGKKYFESTQIGGGQKNSGAKILRKFPIEVPCIVEQQKIANFLTTFDKRIAAQQNIIADLEETKKGLLQKIFSQEIRFKDDNGQDYPDWKKGKLSEIADFLQGLTYHPEDAVNTGKVVLRSSNIRNGQICYKDVVCVDMEIPDKLTLRENDVLMCVRNGSKKLVGKTAIITKGDLGNTWGAFMMILRAKENAGFLFQYINSKYFFKEMFVDLGTATINQITKGMLQKCKMMIPSSAEQQKIAAFLSTFDKKITAERQILSDLKEMKKGLLQQMFM